MEAHGRHAKIGRHFNVGIIGLGEGKGLVKGLQGHPELHVAAICDTNADLAQAVAGLYGVPHTYSDDEKFMAHEGLDIVVIYTPDQLHIRHIRLAFEAGRHVICTKPLVNKLEEAVEVFRLQAAHPDRKLMVGQSSRFFGPMLKQKAAIDAGKLGDLQFVDTRYVHDMRWFYNNRPWAREKDFDLIMACCSHPVDLARRIMGDVEEVHAFADRSKIAEESGFHGLDSFVISYRFKSGRIGRSLGLYGLEHVHQLQPWIEVAAYGSRGTYIARYPQLEAVVKYEGEDEQLLTWFEDNYHYFQFEGVNHHAGEFTNYTEAFAKALVTGTTALPDAADGFKTLATLEAIRTLVRTGKPERVPTFDTLAL